jgi:NADH:ubiquinone oxidoreductase subunit 6 (subunit J)
MASVAPKNAVQPAHSLLSQIGNTPLIRLAKVDDDLPGVEIYAKAEFFNPGGSVKDRAGLNMILEGECSGKLTKNHVLLDANFLAVVQVVIYIGAIAILVIFAVMLTRRVMTDSGPQLNRTWWLAALVALILFGGLMALFIQTPSLMSATPRAVGAPDTVLTDLGRALVDVNRYIVPFEVASVLLLAAMIGAIIIARPPSTGSKAEGEE